MSGTRQDSVMVYSDIENFSEYNRKYGFEQGDRLLKEFAQYIIGTMQKVENTYFARIVSDQFVLFMPYDISVNDIEYQVLMILLSGHIWEMMMVSKSTSGQEYIR